MANGIAHDAFKLLLGKPVWGLSRTIGSSFFLEIGSPLERIGRKKVHGESHFLFEMCHWRFEGGEGVLIGSDDEQRLIDEVFSTLQLGVISAIQSRPPAHDLRITFTDGVELKTFVSSSPGALEGATQWFLFLPNDEVVQVGTDGVVALKSRYGDANATN